MHAIHADPEIHADLREIAAAFSITGGSTYRFEGEDRDVSAYASKHAGPAGGGGVHTLLSLVQGEMYHRKYRRPRAIPGGNGARSGNETLRDFASALSRANSGRGTWEPDWVVADEPRDGQFIVVKDDVRYRACAEEVRDVDAAGRTCRVRVPKEMRQLMLSFYMAFGDAEWPFRAAGRGRVTRWYWSLTPEVAPLYIGEATARLNKLNVPFRTKVIHDPSNYVMADAGVLYAPSDHAATMWPDIRAVYDAVGSGLRAAVPMFSHRLADGLGYAEDPGDGTSFGQSRCQIASAGLWSAYEARENDEEGRSRHVAAAFDAAGISPGAPFISRESQCREPPEEFLAVRYQL